MHPLTSSRTSERSERDPGSITTNVSVAGSWSHGLLYNRHRWLWVPAPVRNCALGGDDPMWELSVSLLPPSSDRPDAPRSCTPADATPIHWLQHRWRGPRIPAPASA